MRADLLLLAVTAAALVASSGLALVAAQSPPSPPWAAPNAFRIFFFHVPLAWTAYLAFGVVFVAGLLYLRSRKERWDALALASAEVGVVLTSLALLLGMVWSRAEQGFFWEWGDPRLFSTLILWLVYVAYLVFRGATPSADEARLAAVLGIFGFALVPVSYASAYFVQSLHPRTGTSTGVYFGGANGLAFGVGMAAFTLLYIGLLVVRLRQEMLRRELSALKAAAEASP